jgi:hypothetical protein
MKRRGSILFWVAIPAVFLVGLFHAAWGAQPQQSRPGASGPSAAASPSEQELSATREQFFRLLRLSPQLTSVVARDPSLLSNQDYVAHKNPELAQFLQQHPEIARSPEFYLFANGWGPGNREQRLEREVWPDLAARSPYIDRTGDFFAFFAFLCLLAAGSWLFKVLLENRRWGRIVKLQSEVHTKLLDRFANNQELLTYMNTEAGRRFLQSAPVPAGPGVQARMSLMRVLTPLQLGVLLMTVGTGLLLLWNNARDTERPFLVLGTIGMMLGLGFIISAGLSYWLARHMGLLPQSTAEIEKNASIDAKERL